MKITIRHKESEVIIDESGGKTTIHLQVDKIILIIKEVMDSISKCK